ncbi:MAG: FAD-dependent oxidoreductase [Sphingomonas sp.]|nr:FAD-dependent oxidoreductase [Sphingomonas sp.]
MKSVTIVGGGVIGLCTGVRLAQAGHRVCVIDDDSDRSAASWGNAGHIATEQVQPLASPANLRSVAGQLFAFGGPVALPPGQIAHWLPFGMRMAARSTPQQFRAGHAALGALMAQAMPAWQRMIDGIGAADLLRADGHFVLWPDHRTADRARAVWQQTDTGTATFRSLTSQEQARLETLGTPFTDGIRFEGTGSITHLGALAEALEAALLASGGILQRGTARLSPDRRFASVEGSEADITIVTAGARSGSLLRRFGYRVPLIAERGYHIRADGGGWDATLPPVVFESRNMIVTRYSDCVQAASFVEFGAIDAPPDPRKWRRLEQHVAELGLPIRSPYRRWMGRRPTLPDYLPAIGCSRRADGLLYAFGHQHLGLTLAAATAEAMVALVDERDTALDLTPFDLERFA